MTRTLNPLYYLSPLFAVRVGFEPTVQISPYDSLANCSFRPLRHLTVNSVGGKCKQYEYSKNKKMAMNLKFG